MNKNVRNTIIVTIVLSLIISTNNILFEDLYFTDFLTVLVSYVIITIVIYHLFKDIKYSYFAYACSFTALLITYIYTIGVNVFSFGLFRDGISVSYYSSFPRDILIPYYIFIYLVLSVVFQEVFKPKTSTGVAIKNIIFYMLSIAINFGFLGYATIVIPSV